MAAQPLWNNTPLLYSTHLSRITNSSVYLKLENLQPAQSFKSRGIGYFIDKVKKERGADVHLIIASGGNAGYAAACASKALNVRCTVYIPEWVESRTLDLLKAQDADVVVIGKVYLEALNAAKEAVDSDNNAVMVPAYDDPIIWEGHASMVDEISSQLGKKPDALFCSVGGGGMLGGIITGCKNVGWDDVPIVALETIGSNCFHHSVLMNTSATSQFATELPPSVTKVHDETGDMDLAHFHAFSSKAFGSLGASRPTVGVVKMAIERQGGVQCVSVQDELSIQASVLLAEDHKLLVELACSTTLVPAYKPQLLNKLVPSRSESRTIVFIVCGGFKVSLEEMASHKAFLESQVGQSAELKVVCGDGDCLKLDYSLE